MNSAFGQHSDTPSRHIVVFAHGVEFDATFFAPGTLRIPTDGFSFRIKLYGLSFTMTNSSGGQSQPRRSYSSGVAFALSAYSDSWSTSVFTRLKIHLFQCFEIGHPAIFLFQVVVDNFPPSILLKEV